MKAQVTEIRSTPWNCDGLMLTRGIESLSDIGVVEHRIILGMESKAGALVPLIAFRFNFRLCTTAAQDGMWFVVCLSHRMTDREATVAKGTFMCVEEPGESSLISCDQDTFSQFASGFLLNRDWRVDVSGENGRVADFRIPKDDTYAIGFNTLLANGRIANAQD